MRRSWSLFLMIFLNGGMMIGIWMMCWLWIAINPPRLLAKLKGHSGNSRSGIWEWLTELSARPQHLCKSDLGLPQVLTWALSSSWQFALVRSDSPLTIFCYTKLKIVRKLQGDLRELDLWADKWQMAFNMKCHRLTIRKDTNDVNTTHTHWRK